MSGDICHSLQPLKVQKFVFVPCLFLKSLLGLQETVDNCCFFTKHILTNTNNSLTSMNCLIIPLVRHKIFSY